MSRVTTLRDEGEGDTKAERNQWLAHALDAQAIEGNWLPFAELERKWIQFVVAGPWRQWRGDARPPVAASTLERALFFATRHSGGETLGAKQIQRVTAQIWRSRIFTSKCE